MPVSSSRQGADRCPDVLRLHQAADGLLGRVSIPASVLPLAAARQFVDAITALGGLVEVTGRANLQVRRLSEASIPGFHQAVAELRECVPFAGSAAQLAVIAWPDEHVSVADLAFTGNTVAAALAGHAPATGGSIGAGSATEPTAAGAPIVASRKFQSVVLTASIYLASFDESLTGADLALGIGQDRLILGTAGLGWRWHMPRSDAHIHQLGAIIAESMAGFEVIRQKLSRGMSNSASAAANSTCAAANSVGAAGELTRAVAVDASKIWHPSDLPESSFAEWLAALDDSCAQADMTRCSPAPCSPAPSSPANATSGQARGTSGSVASAHSVPPVGPSCDGRYVHLRPRGRCLTASALQELQQCAGIRTDSTVALLPWNSILVEHCPSDSPADVAPDVAALTEDLGSWFVDPHDAESRITTCTGKPACLSALADVQSLTKTISTVTGSSSLNIRISGCDRQCGKPNSSHLSVVATPGGWTASISPAAKATSETRSHTNPVQAVHHALAERHALSEHHALSDQHALSQQHARSEQHAPPERSERPAATTNPRQTTSAG